MGVQLGSRKLFITNIETGETHQLNNVSFENIQPEVHYDDKIIPLRTMNFECEIECTTRISPISFLKLIGFRKASNNWLKMQGGVMTRKVKRR